MSIKKKYVCDICGSTTEDALDWLGIYWQSNTNFTTEKPVWDCQKHLCPICSLKLWQQLHKVHSTPLDTHRQGVRGGNTSGI